MISAINLSLGTIFETEPYLALVAERQKNFPAIDSFRKVPAIPPHSWHTLFPRADSDGFIKVQTPHDFFSSFLSKKIKDKFGEEINPETTCLTGLEYTRENQSAPYPGRITHKISLTDAFIKNIKTVKHSKNTQGIQDVQVVDDFWKRYISNPTTTAIRADYTEAVYFDPVTVHDNSSRWRVSAEAILDFLGTLDAGSLYRNYLDGFWKDVSVHDYADVLRDDMLHAAARQSDEGSLSVDAQNTILNAIGVSWQSGWTDMFVSRKTMMPEDRSATLETGHIGLDDNRHVATAMIYMHNTASNTVVLYVPGNSSPFHTFSSTDAMKVWIGAQLADPVTREAIETQFALDERSDNLLSWTHGTTTLFDRMHAYDSYTGWRPKYIPGYKGSAPTGARNLISLKATQDIFLESARHIKARSYSDGVRQVMTNSDVLKKEILNAVEIVNSIATIAALPFFPGSAITSTLLFTATGAAQLGVGIDNQVHGKADGIGDIIYGALNALPLQLGLAAATVKFASQEVDKILVYGAIYYISGLIPASYPKASSICTGKRVTHLPKPGKLLTCQKVRLRYSIHLNMPPICSDRGLPV